VFREKRSSVYCIYTKKLTILSFIFVCNCSTTPLLYKMRAVISIFFGSSFTLLLSYSLSLYSRTISPVEKFFTFLPVRVESNPSNFHCPFGPYT